MDFLSVLDIPTAEITVDGKKRMVQRLPFRHYYILKQLDREFQSTDPHKQIEAMFDYIGLAAGIDAAELTNVTEIPELLDTLMELNDIEQLPWLTVQSNKMITTTADYDNRMMAWMVHLLANAYGWDQEYVLDLQPFAVFCYAQEILLDAWEADESAYRLSEVAYDEKGHYKPYPKPTWYSEIVGPRAADVKLRIPARYLPSGVVIDYEEEYNKRKADKIGRKSGDDHTYEGT